MDNKCKICNVILISKKSKTCTSKVCKSKWKMERNKNLPPVEKTCSQCGSLFSTIDRRNNYCSSECKCVAANNKKLEKYGTLSLESIESRILRGLKQQKPKVSCSILGCGRHAQSKGFCHNHYIKHHYLETEHGKNIYRLGNHRRRVAESSKIIPKAELQFIRAQQKACQKCGNDSNLSMDHHIPLTKGGFLQSGNVVILCGSCNSSKHNKDPEGFYTEEELARIQSSFELIDHIKSQLKTIYFLFGCFGVGKTWIANQLTDKFTVIEYDKYRLKSIDAMLDAPEDKPILFVASVKISPFINKYSMTFNIKSIALIESLETIEERIAMRNGNFTESIKKRFKRMEVLERRYSDFSGNSEDVLEYLKNV